MYLISVIIPVKNGEATLYDCLNGYAKQSRIENIEIIVIDSGSRDKSVEIAKSFSFVRLYQVEPEMFNHGLTRNLGVKLAKGEFVLMTVQDAVPADPFMLEKMISHFSKPEVAGVCGQQLVPQLPDNNPHEWFRPRSNPVPQYYRFDDKEVFLALPPNEQKKICSWDDVCAMYRKKVLVEIPFVEVTFGEDMLWAKEAILAGHMIVYDFNARVEHYHQMNRDYQYRRILTMLYFTYRVFGYHRKLSYSLIDYLKVVYRNFQYKASFKWIRYNFIKMGATLKANKDFSRAVAKGDAYLDAFHELHCKKAPQAVRIKVK